MNYTFSVSCLCVLYSLSLVSSQRDLPTDGKTTNSPRLRALTPYASQQGITQNHEGVNITADSDSDGEFCVVTSQKRPSITSDPQQPYPISPAHSPLTLNTRLGHRRVLSNDSELTLEGDMPSSPRHQPSPDRASNTPQSGHTILGSLQQQRERDGLPVMSSIEHSNAVQKEATTPTSDTFSQMPPSAISTFAGLTLSGLTQRRNSGSPKNKQREQVLNGRTNVQTTPPHSSAVALSAAAHRYQLNQTMIENPALQACANQNNSLTNGQQLVGTDFIDIPLDPEEKTAPDHHVIAVEGVLKPRTVKPNCFDVLCCCCLFKKTKKR